MRCIMLLGPYTWGETNEAIPVILDDIGRHEDPLHFPL